MNIWIAAALFTLAAFIDIAWSRWTLTVNQHRTIPAAAWAFIICLPAALTVNAYVTDWIYILPYAAGAAVGTGIATHRTKPPEKS